MYDHGQSRTGTYTSWKAMLNRCYDPKNASYTIYGARGITVQESWKDFNNFIQDMGHRPAKTSLDRIDPNGNYTKENCRWADLETQQNNRRNSVIVELDGIVASVSQHCRRKGFDRNIVYNRLRSGATIEQAFLSPEDYKKRDKLKLLQGIVK